MHMKNVILIILSLSFVWCQGQTLLCGEKLNKKYKKKHLKFCVDAGKTYVLNKSDDFHYTLDIYSQSLSKISKKVELPRADYHKVKLLSMEVVDRKLSLFFKATNRFDEKTMFWAVHLDLKSETNEFQAKEMKYSIKKDYRSMKYEKILTNASKTMVFMIQSTDPESDKQKELVVGAYDANYNLLYDIDLSLEDKVVHEAIRFDDLGNLYLLLEQEDDDTQLRNQNHYTIRQYLWGIDKFKTYTLQFPDAYITSANYGFNDKNELIGTAYYGLKRKKEANGLVSFMIVNAAGGPEFKVFERQAFNDEYRKDLLSKRAYKRGRGLKNYKIHKVLAINDTAFATISEYVIERKGGGGGGGGYAPRGGGGAGGPGMRAGGGGVNTGGRVYYGGGGSGKTYYEKNHILVSCSYRNGTYNNPQYIAKKHKMDEVRVGVKCFVKDQKVHILFNQHERYTNVFDLKPVDIKKRYKKKRKNGILIDCVVEAKGLKEYKIIDKFKKRDRQRWPIDNLFDELDQKGNIFLLKNERMRKFGLVKIEF